VSLTSAKDPTFTESGQRKPHRNARASAPIPIPQGPDALARYKGRYDIEFWAWWALGVRLNRGQRRFVRACALRG
jgi:hypothetical protein